MFVERVDIHAMMDRGDGRIGHTGRRLQRVLTGMTQRFVGHPNEHGVDVMRPMGLSAWRDEKVSAADVDLVLKRQGDRPPGPRDVEVAIHGDDASDVRRDTGGKSHDSITGPDDARRNRACEATEIEVGAGDQLDGKPEAVNVDTGLHIDRLEVFHHRRSAEPGQVLGPLDHVVPEEGRHRQEHRVGEVEALCERQIVGPDVLEALLGPVDEVHLVDRDRNMANAQQVRDEAVPLGLGDDPVAGVHQDDGELARRGAGDHVAGVLLMARGVGDDELPPRCREVAIGNVDRDSLLPLGFESVGQEREIDVAAGTPLGRRVGLETGEGVLVDHLRVVEQAPDEGGLPIVDRATGQEPEQVLAFVFGQVGLDVGCDEVGLMTH